MDEPPQSTTKVTIRVAPSLRANKKLRLSSRADLVQYAVKRKWFDMNPATVKRIRA